MLRCTYNEEYEINTQAPPGCFMSAACPFKDPKEDCPHAVEEPDFDEGEDHEPERRRYPDGY